MVQKSDVKFRNSLKESYLVNNWNEVLMFMLICIKFYNSIFNILFGLDNIRFEYSVFFLI